MPIWFKSTVFKCPKNIVACLILEFDIHIPVVFWFWTLQKMGDFERGFDPEQDGKYLHDILHKNHEYVWYSLYGL